MLSQCLNCSRPEDGLCPFIRAEDGLDVRCVGKWSKDKLYYLRRYIDMFCKSMHGKWNLVYLDAFCGPGICIDREHGTMFPGSPLIAAEFHHYFSEYVFVDINSRACNTLRTRLHAREMAATYEVLADDCNQISDRLRKSFGDDTLGLAFLDPSSMQLNFSTIRTLTRDLRIDLIINFPLYAINRTYKVALDGRYPGYAPFFGEDTEWREIAGNAPGTPNIATRLVPLYKRQLERLGYVYTSGLAFDAQHDIPVKGPNNATLYYLLFASKDRLGHHFWDQAHKVRSDLQRELLWGVQRSTMWKKYMPQGNQCP